MNKLLDLIISAVTAERLCEWLCAELSSSNPGMRELPSGEYLSVFPECTTPECGNPFYHVVIHGLLKDLDTGRESYIDSLAWLVIRPLSETHQQLIGHAYIYADMLQGWIDSLGIRMRMVFVVDEVQGESDGNMVNDYSLIQTSSEGEANVWFPEQDSSLEKIGGQMKQLQGTNLEIAITINTNIQRFEAWLDRYRIQTTPFIVELEDGKSLSVYGSPTYKGQHQGVRNHEIIAAISTPHPTEPNCEVHSFTFPVIEIELFEPAENRLIVKLLCRHRRLILYYLNMLREIAKLWPETAKEVYNYILQFIPEEERKELIVTRLENYEESVNSLADNLAGTVNYWRNDQGQIVILGGTVNPGYRFEIGEQGLSITSATPQENRNQNVDIGDISTHTPRPWEQSRPKDQNRDKTIWELRQSNNTWEDIAEQASCGVSTAKEVYKRLLARVNKGKNMSET